MTLMQPLTFSDQFLLYNTIENISTHDYITIHLKKLAKDILLDQSETISNTLGLKANTIKIKSLTSRWGSCSTLKNINLNWKLIHTPINVINYVIIHEFVHLLHMNHSETFWQTVKKYCPTYLKDKKWLKDYGDFVQNVY